MWFNPKNTCKPMYQNKFNSTLEMYKMIIIPTHIFQTIKIIIFDKYKLHIKLHLKLHSKIIQIFKNTIIFQYNLS